MKEKIKWLVGSQENKPYTTTTWFRCFGIEKFVGKVEEEHQIVAVIFNDNNIGFILDNKENDL